MASNCRLKPQAAQICWHAHIPLTVPAKLVREWLAEPGRRIELHFIPAYCPHLNPIERLWGLMHRNLTHNRCYATYNEFCDTMLWFLNEKVPKNWSTLCDYVSDNFRVISPQDFRVLT